MGFCKIFSHPHMETKAQARTESDDIAPLTYCSDMQIPSLPLKTESASTFKANSGFIVHVAPWSTAAQHSWLAHTPAAAVPGSSRPLHPGPLCISCSLRNKAVETTRERETETQREENRAPGVGDRTPLGLGLGQGMRL